MSYTALHEFSVTGLGKYKYISSMLSPLFCLASLGIITSMFSFGKNKHVKAIIISLILVSFLSLSLASINAQRGIGVGGTTGIESSDLKIAGFEQYQDIKQMDISLDYSCRVVLNGYGNLLQYYYPFEPDKIRIIFDKDSLLEELNSGEGGCMYFVQGYYDEDIDKGDGIGRIYDNHDLEQTLREEGFREIYSKDIRGIKTFIQYRGMG
jgi:hypothetical protein